MVEKLDYKSRAKTASRIIERFGQIGVLQKFDKEGVLTKQYATIFAVMQYDDVERNSDLIRPGDRKVIMQANVDSTAFPPTGEDRLKMVSTGEIVRIVASRPFAPAGVPVYFDLQVRT